MRGTIRADRIHLQPQPEHADPVEYALQPEGAFWPALTCYGLALVGALPGGVPAL